MWTWLLLNWRWAIYGLIAAVIAAGAAYTGWLANKTEKQAQTIEVLEQQVAAYVDEIEAYVALQARYAESEAIRDDLERKLARHDIGTLAERKPGLVERRVNAATVRLFDDIEAASRAADRP